MSRAVIAAEFKPDKQGDSSMPRKTHLVGAWPGISAPHAMDTALRRLGPHLLRMSDGETGDRSTWVTPTIEWLRANPDVELIRDATYTSYEDTPLFALRNGRTIDPANIHLDYHLNFQRSYPAFRELRARHGYPDIAFQVGVPAPFDLAVYTVGHDVAMKDQSIADAFAAATIREIEAIRADAGDDVIFQLETVVAMVAVARTPADQQADVADRMANALVSPIGMAPEGTRFGVHLCLGDFHHRAMAEMGSARPLVLLTNRVAKAWPPGRALEYIHTPFAAASKPGSLDPSWYDALAELDLPESVRFVAGFVHEHLGLDALREVRALIERQAGREVDVAATCGLGRRDTLDEVWDAMDKSVALLN